MKAKKGKIIFKVILRTTGKREIVTPVYCVSYHAALKHVENDFILDEFEEIVIEKVESRTGNGLYSKKQRVIG